MAIDVSVPRTRRALLAGGIGGLAAIVASALGRPLPADAASGDFVSAEAGIPAVKAQHILTSGSPALGVHGRSASTSGVGVLGHAYNSSGIGVYGCSGTTVCPRGPAKAGVYGYAKGDGSACGVTGQTTAGVGVRGVSTAGTGVRGESDSGDGVIGSAGAAVRSGVYGYTTNMDGFGVFGRDKASGATGALGAGIIGVHGASPAASGVVGSSGSAAPPVSGETGVHGYAISSASARGVHGQTTIGTGVYATATTGYALRAVGRVKLDQCAGVATIAATKSSVVVTPGVDLVSTSAVVATLQGSAGSPSITVSRCVVNVTTNTFTIYLTQAATQNVKVAWIVLG